MAKGPAHTITAATDPKRRKIYYHSCHAYRLSFRLVRNLSPLLKKDAGQAGMTKKKGSRDLSYGLINNCLIFGILIKNAF